MTDTFQPSTRSEELRVAKTLLHRLREDLFTDAFAFRPLPPLPADHRLVRTLPRRAARYTRWLPHAVVVGFALMVMLATTEHAGLVPALFVGVPIMTTLVRPVGAWWLSFGVMFLTGMVLPFGSSVSPWSPGGFLPHLAVMVLVALRTRPRVAAGMWLLTGALAVFLGVFRSYGAPYGGELFQMMAFSGFVLFAVVAIRGLREGKQQVEAQAAVTEAERSRRTLLEERTTIARELHDVVAHHMSVVAIQAEAAPYRVQDTPPELAAAFQTIRENAVAALTELRRVLGVVRSEEGPDTAPEAPQPTLADLGLLLANVRSAGLEVEHVITGAVRPLPQGVELSAYRIVQEALSNVLRHAPGAAARVEVSYVLGGLGLRIVNGPADRLAKPSPGAGHGVLGMRERVGMLGGGMTAGATGDGGYEVAAFIPVAVHGEDAA
ncbi:MULTISPECIES: sensor histidine kinase [Streptomyces]|uniref:histidine kinase n=1 Tax=Streptomyces morookaense TaxID=1970 RepID=A0A7Y7B129_STRMO|nr:MULTISPECIES: histidine kinase [Streptomyces]MCC2275143.1 histidine kinase [Streptomyces sp. ET3-23]NVK76915.1 two-component sensor histidine kinase [Streptomyces morookaense]GHF25605.1 two-component sensor histidine kinase [Streptomyces morookaense]